MVRTRFRVRSKLGSEREIHVTPGESPRRLRELCGTQTEIRAFENAADGWWARQGSNL
jgi:hypothetical protein